MLFFTNTLNTFMIIGVCFISQPICELDVKIV